MQRIAHAFGLATLAVTIVVPASAAAQKENRPPPSPLASFVLSGYGSAEYGAFYTSDEFANDFTASVSPVILFQMGRDFLFETELEFGLSGEVTTTTLEYAQIDYLGLDRVIVSFGKFLMPFGLFGERLHASWINKLPNTPLLYGHAHGGVAEETLLPIMSDAGLLVRLNRPLGATWGLNVSLYVTQGPRLVTADEVEDDDHAHNVVPGDASYSLAGADPLDITLANVPLVGFGTAFNDNNDNKLIGARLGLVQGPKFEAYLSGFHAMYDAGDFLDLYGGALAADLRLGNYDLRAEGALLRQEFEHEGDFDFVSRPGYYIQAARRIGNFEPVVRWSHLLDPKVSGTAIDDGRQRLALGMDYWFDATVPVKLMWEWDSLDHDHVILQWAFGF